MFAAVLCDRETVRMGTIFETVCVRAAPVLRSAVARGSDGWGSFALVPTGPREERRVVALAYT